MGEKRSRPEPVAPSQRPGLLTLLTRDGAAMRLIAAWPNVDRRGSREDVIARWSRMANVRPLEVRAKWDLLFDNGFLTIDGRVDPLVDRYVQSVTIALLPPAARPKPRETQPSETKGETL